MSYTKAEAVRLLEKHINRSKLDAPYIAALERVANWAALDAGQGENAC